MFAIKLFDMLCYALPFYPLSPCQQTHSHTHRASGTVHTAMEVATGQEVRTVAPYTCVAICFPKLRLLVSM